MPTIEPICRCGGFAFQGTKLFEKHKDLNLQEGIRQALSRARSDIRASEGEKTSEENAELEARTNALETRLTQLARLFSDSLVSPRYNTMLRYYKKPFNPYDTYREANE